MHSPAHTHTAQQRVIRFVCNEKAIHTGAGGRPIVLRAELLRRFAPLPPTPKTKRDGMGAVHCQQEISTRWFSPKVENQTQNVLFFFSTVAGRVVAVGPRVLSFWCRAWRSLFTTLSAGGVIKG
jgi:hypothetical protein